MASNGSVKTSAYDGRRIQFSWSTNSQSIDRNETSIHWSLRGTDGPSEYHYYYTGPVRAWVNGTKVYDSSTRFELYRQEIASGNITIPHNTDGTKTFSVKVEAAIYSSSINCTASTNFTLDTIPRTSNFTINKTEITFGESIMVSINRSSNNFTHTISVSCNGDSFTDITSGVATSYAFIVDPEIYGPRLSSASNNIVLKVSTISNGNSIGSKNSQAVNVLAPDSMAPIINLSIKDNSDSYNVFGAYIKTKSIVQATSIAETKYGSSIVSHILSDGYSTVNSTGNTIVQINNGLSTKFTANATDSRGKATSKDILVNYLDYANPSISSASATRCDQNGELDDEGLYIKVAFNYKIYSLDDKNSKSCSYSYAMPDGTKVSEDISLSKYSGAIERIFAADTEKTYIIEITLSDYFTSTNVILNGSTAFTLLDFGANGKSIAIGKVSTNENGIIDIANGWSVSGDKSKFNTIDATTGSILSLTSNSGEFSSIKSQSAEFSTESIGDSTISNLTITNSLSYNGLYYPKYAQAIGTDSSVSMSNGVFTQVPLKSMLYNNDSTIFELYSNSIRVKKTGYYRVCGCVYITRSSTNTANMSGSGCYIKVGTSFSSATEYQSSMSGLQGSHAVIAPPMIIKINANQIIFLAGRVTNSNGGTLAPNNKATYLYVEYIGS